MHLTETQGDFAPGEDRELPADTDQAEQIARFVAQDFRVISKVANTVNKIYEAKQNNALYREKITEVKALVQKDVANITLDIVNLNEQLTRYTDQDSYFFDPEKANEVRKQLATQNEILSEGINLRSQLEQFQDGNHDPSDIGP